MTFSVFRFPFYQSINVNRAHSMSAHPVASSQLTLAHPGVAEIYIHTTACIYCICNMPYIPSSPQCSSGAIAKYATATRRRLTHSRKKIGVEKNEKKINGGKRISDGRVRPKRERKIGYGERRIRYGYKRAQRRMKWHFEQCGMCKSGPPGAPRTG